MLYTALIASYIIAYSCRAMLGMLLMLVVCYILAACWLASMHLMVSALLYILIYIGAIVVLYVFVIQLTDTSIAYHADKIDPYRHSIKLAIALMMIASMSYIAYIMIYDDNCMLYIFKSYDIDMIASHDMISSYSYNNITAAATIQTLAHNIYGQYAYVMLISINAIVLAVVAAIPIALMKL